MAHPKTNNLLTFIFIIQWKRKRDVLKNVHTALFHTLNKDGDQGLSISKNDIIVLKYIGSKVSGVENLLFSFHNHTIRTVYCKTFT